MKKMTLVFLISILAYRAFAHDLADCNRSPAQQFNLENECSTEMIEKNMKEFKLNDNGQSFYIHKRYFTRWGKYDPSSDVIYYQILANRLNIATGPVELAKIQKIFDQTPSSEPFVMPSLDDLRPGMKKRLITLGASEQDFEAQEKKLRQDFVEISNLLMFIQNENTLPVFQPEEGIILTEAEARAVYGDKYQADIYYIHQERCNRFVLMRTFLTYYYQSLEEFNLQRERLKDLFVMEMKTLYESLDQRSHFKKQLADFYNL